MLYYIKKYLPSNFSASVFEILLSALSVLTSLLIIAAAQGLMDNNHNYFGFIMVMLVLTWGLIIVSRIIRTFFQSRAIRQMNNELRRDIAACLLHKTHQEYHKQESGEYISQFTNDINQIEQLAWKPFFSLMGTVGNVLFGIIALMSIHWLLTAISLVVAVIMILAPRLFRQRLERIGASCAAGQANGVSQIKDLLEGYDILRFLAKINDLQKELIPPVTK